MYSLPNTPRGCGRVNYADLTATQRDTLLAVVALDGDTDPTLDAIHGFHERHFGPISQHSLSASILPALREASLVVQHRSASDGRVHVNRPTEAGRELVRQALRERQRWVEPPEPGPEDDGQRTLAEVVR